MQSNVVFGGIGVKKYYLRDTHFFFSSVFHFLAASLMWSLIFLSAESEANVRGAAVQYSAPQGGGC